MLNMDLDDLLKLPRKELATIVIRFRDDLKSAYIRIADDQRSIKKNRTALRNAMRIVRSLRQTVKRRRKVTKKHNNGYTKF